MSEVLDEQVTPMVRRMVMKILSGARSKVWKLLGGTVGIKVKWEKNGHTTEMDLGWWS